MPNQSGSRGHFEDRNRRVGWNGPSARGMSYRYGPSSSSSLSSSSHLGGGYRRNQQQINRSRSRSKSQSPSRSRSRSYSPQSDRSRSRSPSHDRGRTKEKTRNKTLNRVQSTSRSPGPTAKRTRVNSKSSGEEEGEEEKEEKPFTRRRCRDYDERGFCMRGDFCQYDHGSDPVVLDGSSVVLGLAANGVPTLASNQNLSSVGSTNFLNEPYNPEAPGIDKQINPHGSRRGSGVGSLTGSSRGSAMGSNYNHLSQHPFWGPMASPLRPIPPGSNSGPFIPSQGQSKRPRELAGVPTLSENKISSLPSSINNPDMPKSTIDTSSNLSGNNNSMSKRGNNSGRGGGSGSGHRNNFRGGYFKRMVTNESADKCTLEVRKIPPNLNTIANLNSHFSKFGSIVNLQVCYDGDPEAALVQFASHSDALASHRCTEAVLNNRFIKVFWHSKDQNKQHQQSSSSQPSHNQGPGHQQHGNMSSFDSSSRERAANGGLISDSCKSDSNNSRPNVKERLGLRHAHDHEKNSASTNVSNSGSISRTVFNPNLLKKQYPSSPKTTPSKATSSVTTTTTSKVGNVAVASNPTEPLVPVKRKEDLEKDKLLKKLELQKKRQQILVACMQQQKLLIDKLEKSKTDKERADIRSTVEALNSQIKKLESEIKKDAEVILAETSKLPSSGKKSKIQVEKELLDIEMDFYNDLHKGATTADLDRKLRELQIKAKSICMNDIRSTKAMTKRFFEMKSALRGRNRMANHTLAKNFENLRKVDRRTRKVFIEGVTEDDNNVVLAHLSQTAEIESLESTPQGVMVTFKTRRDAEMALPLISTIKLKDQTTLKASWFDEDKVKSKESEVNSLEKTPYEFETFNENDLLTNDNEIDEVLNQEEDGDELEEEVGSAGLGREGKEEILEELRTKEGEEVIQKEDQDDDEDATTEIDEDLDATENRAVDDDDDETLISTQEVNRETNEGVNEGEVVAGANENADQEKQTWSPYELLLGVDIEDDLLEEEETDDEDESRAWRR